ncbi:unnamed protein product [Arabidopsis lyrata]|nr:unnamed protein product [Arabidopsis lyrata]
MYLRSRDLEFMVDLRWSLEQKKEPTWKNFEDMDFGGLEHQTTRSRKGCRLACLLM